MAIFGITSLNHDASIALVDRDEILFAGHAERYSRLKNDDCINHDLVIDALGHGQISEIVWADKPWQKAARMAYAGQAGWSRHLAVRSHLNAFRALHAHPVRFVGHHESHAAGGYFTSSFDDAAILVVDAIGEWDTISMWVGEGTRLRRIWRQRYPHSLGLLYSAFTDRLGLKPNEEEYITMGMAAFGKPRFTDAIRRDFLASGPLPGFRLRANVHRGIRHWRPADFPSHTFNDLAASIQRITEDYLLASCNWLRAATGKRNLVLAGGVALNCVANTKIARSGIFDRIWIMPNPGDAGNALGAALARLRRHVNWRTPYLGRDIDRPLDTAAILERLLTGDVIGIANGRAEYGPRALGNRSLLCDPRGPYAKDRVNGIKRREPFRPFAPVVLAEHAGEYFDMPVPSSPYMQFVAGVKRPDLFPAITHIDGTARVQTLTREQNPALHDLLTRFHRTTGCPMLLNTSLNVKGEPLVDTRDDALRFEAATGVRVF